MAVYPRPRGEYKPLWADVDTPYGLPPPTRGIPVHLAAQGNRRGSTPAHAGNTFGGGAVYLYDEVYPRPRGEYGSPRRPTRSFCGLPPPTRGILPNMNAYIQSEGSTPAHAGNTLSEGGDTCRQKVYPRPRGEYGNLAFRRRY